MYSSEFLIWTTTKNYDIITLLIEGTILCNLGYFVEPTSPFWMLLQLIKILSSNDVNFHYLTIMNVILR